MTYTLEATNSTFIKSAVLDSTLLKPEEKVFTKKGYKLDVVSCKYASKGHLEVITFGGDTSYLFRPHWKLDPRLEPAKPGLPPNTNSKGQIIVPYSNQRDNWDKYHGPGSRQCNLTSCTMQVRAVKPGYLESLVRQKGYIEPEDVLGEILYPYGDTTDHAALTRALRSIGIESYFTYTASISDLLLSYKVGVPVVLGVAYKASGHMILGKGSTKDGSWINDPYGVRDGFSDYYFNRSGENDFVTWRWLKAKWVDMGDEAGWARFVTKVDGKPTGVPYGM